MSQFGERLSAENLAALREEDLAEGSGFGYACLGWIWSQWLQGIKSVELQSRIRAFVDRGMLMQSICPRFHKRPTNDLYLLHCAIFGSEAKQLEELARNCVEVDGYKEFKPANDGELYVRAWVGMLKHWILGDSERAMENANEIWFARKSPVAVGATKPLVTRWLKED